VSSHDRRPSPSQQGAKDSTWGDLDYVAFLRSAGVVNPDELVALLKTELPYLCRDAYLESTLRPTEILRFQHGTFEYVFDNYTALETANVVPYSLWEESRLVVACGTSSPQKTRGRDDSRLKGWIGPTGLAIGTGWDKGHYIGHSIGGAVEGVEANVFIQRRDLNRGWSKAGRRFRALEQYCARNAGTFCFARPIYIDGTARPGFVEFGLLKIDGSLRVEGFDNR
jgi:hypothetical protein